jgi:hypothetical protein
LLSFQKKALVVSRNSQRVEDQVPFFTGEQERGLLPLFSSEERSVIDDGRVTMKTEEEERRERSKARGRERTTHLKFTSKASLGPFFTLNASAPSFPPLLTHICQHPFWT